jgi:hypothetical protein
VHRNTVAAAYRLLRDRRLVTADLGAPPRVRRGVVPVSAPAIGSGVVDPGESHASVAVRLVREMTSRARAEGVSRRELAGHIAPWLGDGAPPRLCLVEPRPGLHATLHAELQARLSTAIASFGRRAMWADRARTDRRLRTAPVLIVARPEVADRIEGRFPGVHPIQPLVLGGGSRALADARAIRRPGVVALVTRSLLIRRFARELAAGHHGSGLSLALPDPEDPAALRRAARIARLILVDASCRGMRLETRGRVRSLHVLSRPTIRALKWYLGGQTKDVFDDESPGRECHGGA